MCYTVPLTAAVATTLLWKKNRSPKIWWLNLMFYGGGLFGVIDHLWNGELFLISKDWLKDLSLGVVITGAVLLAWCVILALAKKNTFLNNSLVGLEVK